jgi:hypothetical protein
LTLTATGAIPLTTCAEGVKHDSEALPSGGGQTGVGRNRLKRLWAVNRRNSAFAAGFIKKVGACSFGVLLLFRGSFSDLLFPELAPKQLMSLTEWPRILHGEKGG